MIRKGRHAVEHEAGPSKAPTVVARFGKVIGEPEDARTVGEMTPGGLEFCLPADFEVALEASDLFEGEGGVFVGTGEVAGNAVDVQIRE